MSASRSLGKVPYAMLSGIFFYQFVPSFTVRPPILPPCLEAEKPQQNGNLRTRTAPPMSPLRQASSVSLGGATLPPPQANRASRREAFTF